MGSSVMRPKGIAMWDLFRSHPAICIESDGVIRTAPLPRALLPGSFNPLHQGHTALAAVASARLGVPVHFEMSMTNVDKPELPQHELVRRVAQFAEVAPIWLTRAATFAEKATLFPGTAFVVGWDTAIRLVDSKYYGGAAERDRALLRMMESGTRFVVGGRLDEADSFRVWDRNSAAEGFAELFFGLSEKDFRVDVCSRALRAGAAGE
jgi:hypothetical protein